MGMTVTELLQDKARQSPTSTLYAITPDAVVADAVSLMVKSEISSIVVKEGNEMVGLITLRGIPLSRAARQLASMITRHLLNGPPMI